MEEYQREKLTLHRINHEGQMPSQWQVIIQRPHFIAAHQFLQRLFAEDSSDRELAVQKSIRYLEIQIAETAALEFNTHIKEKWLLEEQEKSGL